MVRQTFYFSDGPYLQAMHGLHSALSGAEALVKFIGQPRTGKSGVCEKLTQFMRHKDYRVIYFDYALESPDLLRSSLAKELDIPDSFNMLRHLEDSLASENHQPLVIIFDDAHQLSDITLIDIYRLAGVQVAHKRGINIVLCGEPELERRLSSKQEFTPLLQHVSHNFLLEPMDAQETSHFLTAFLEKMQLPGLQLEPGAISQFYKSCKGFPGPAYALCQLVLSLRQHSQELSPISKEDLQRAIRNAGNDMPVPSRQAREGNRWMIVGPIVIVIIIASLALLARELSPPQLGDEVNIAADIAIDSPIDSTIDSAIEPITGGPVASPFAADEVSITASGRVTPTSAGNENVVVLSAPPVADEIEEELPASDSSLALVTAQERGISQEIISQPEFEQLGAAATGAGDATALALSLADDTVAISDTVQLSNITLTRPMLALDDEEIVEESAARPPQANPQASPAEPVDERSPAAVESAVAETITAQQMVQSWLDAWQDKDLEQYFASYDENFVPRYHRSKAAWRSNRDRVIGNARQINLELSDFVIVAEDSELIEVHFWLAYRSPSYRDDTRKKLILRKYPATNQAAARLAILEEINLEVRV
ncbi:MAG: ATP-binding protein [Pseudohongiellaceae bacterium]